LSHRSGGAGPQTSRAGLPECSQETVALDPQVQGCLIHGVRMPAPKVRAYSIPCLDQFFDAQSGVIAARGGLAGRDGPVGPTQQLLDQNHFTHVVAFQAMTDRLEKVPYH